MCSPKSRHAAKKKIQLKVGLDGLEVTFRTVLTFAYGMVSALAV